MTDLADETDDDPLDGAAVGETRTFEHMTTVHMIDAVPFDYVGRDRDYDVDVTNMEVVQDDREGYFDDVRIEYQVSATKRLPPHWDRCNEPRTEVERKRSARRRWLQRAGEVGIYLLPVVLVTWIAGLLMSNVASEITINGESVAQPTTGLLTAMAILLLVLILAIQRTLAKHYPPTHGRVH